MGLLTWIVVGLIAGWLAGMIVKGGGFGLIGDLIMGVVGALVGGFLAGAIFGIPDPISGFNLTTLIVAGALTLGVHLSLPVALVFGALISATDPVAVVALADEIARYVPDLRRDPFHCWLEKWHVIPLLVLSLILAAWGAIRARAIREIDDVD